jgi:pimeloyl-ACP methyl ester carboxylesterase
VSTTHQFKFDYTTLHYQKHGSGPKVILVFHGFGQTHQSFSEIRHFYEKEVTLFIFDLPFHGQSTWGYGETPLEKKYWKELLQVFLDEQNIVRFNLIGFSMGGKFALACIEAFADRIDEVTLIAPDGIKTSFWYSLATYPLAFRNLFKSMIAKPKRFYRLTKMAFNLGLIDKGLWRFVESQMNTKEKRERVYYSWVVFRHFKFDMNHIARLINSNNILLTIIVGKFDKIITAKNMDRLLSLTPKATLQIIDSGHNTMITKWAGMK